MSSVFFKILGINFLFFNSFLTAQNKIFMNTLHQEKITLGGGCYWCTEAVYQQVKGVLNIESGFSGGHVKNPSYREVCSGNTGHAEVIQITFDNSQISLTELLRVFFSVHDPTTLNRQGDDIGTQYRSVIFYHSDIQKKTAQNVIDKLNKSHIYAHPIVTEVVPFMVFYKAEANHQNYYRNNTQEPYCRLVIQPKLQKFEKLFNDLQKK